MNLPESHVDVHLGERSYAVRIGYGNLRRIGSVLREHRLNQKDAFIITNEDVSLHYGAGVEQSLREAGFQRVVVHKIPCSEEGKNWEVFSGVCAALLESFPESISTPLVLLLGGGVVGDLGGFAAAVFRRGVPFVQIPTTLLAAVDSSVGGKVAVNFGGVKNIMGAFSQPALVLCDLETLKSLPARQIRSGLAEVIKYGAVCSRRLFEELESGAIERMLALDPETVVSVTTQSVQLKAAVVEQDEYDRKGIRNVLNFGHTVGHAIELSADYELTHGEAIAIGMIAATRLAIKTGCVTAGFLERLQGLIERAGLPTRYSGGPGFFDRAMKAMQKDKKFRDGKNVFIYPSGIGSWEQRENVDWNLVHEAVRSVI